jgi:hypothetical protein
MGQRRGMKRAKFVGDTPMKLLTATSIKNPSLFWSKITKTEPSECWIWNAGRDGNYGRYSENVGGKVYNYRSHRVAFVLAGGQFTEAHNCCLHSCHVPLCCNPSHLRSGSPQMNSDDMMAAGRESDQRGARNHAAKLNAAQFEWALAMRRLGYSYREIAEPFGVSLDAIFVFCKRRGVKPTSTPVRVRDPQTGKRVPQFPVPPPSNET